MLKTYIGEVTERGICTVIVEEGGARRPLSMCFDLRRHSPDGFNWGYAGSGPAQLALALMCDLYDKPRREAGLSALHPVHYQKFKAAFVQRLEQGEPWFATEYQLREIVAGIKERING